MHFQAVVTDGFIWKGLNPETTLNTSMPNTVAIMGVHGTP